MAKITNEKIKRNTKEMLPAMTCNKELVAKFKEESKAKKWKFTTLMNEILESRYNQEVKQIKDNKKEDFKRLTAEEKMDQLIDWISDLQEENANLRNKLESKK